MSQSPDNTPLMRRDPQGAGPPRRDFSADDPLGLAGLPLLPTVATEASPSGLLARLVPFPGLHLHPTIAEATSVLLGKVLRRGDHAIVDADLFSGVLETVLGLGATPHRCPSGSVDAVERRLRRLSGGAGRVVVVLPTVTAFGSVVADLPAILDVANAHGARVVLEVGRDLGLTGQTGGGLMEVQRVTGAVHAIFGSFATLGGTGGFCAVRGMAAPPQTSLADARTLAAAALVMSAEGRLLRRRLESNVLRLRNHLMADGVSVMGQPSSRVPVRLPLAFADARTRLLESAGIRVRLVTAPLVARHAPRWLIHVSALQSAADIDDLADLLREVTQATVRDAHRTRYASGFTDAVT